MAKRALFQNKLEPIKIPSIPLIARVLPKIPIQLFKYRFNEAHTILFYTVHIQSIHTRSPSLSLPFTSLRGIEPWKGCMPRASCKFTAQ